MMPKFEIVLPCYNEAPGLASVLTGFCEAAERHGFSPNTFRLIAVDNGSNDATESVLDALSAGRYGQWIRRVALAENAGYGGGIQAGLLASVAPYVGWTHADGQCPPEDIFKAYRGAVASTNSLVMGRRTGRRFSAWVLSRAYEIAVLVFLRKLFVDINAQPKVFPRALIPFLVAPPAGVGYDLYVLLKARERGYTIESFKVHFGARRYGKSHWAATWALRVRTIRAVVRFLRGYKLGETSR